MERTLLMFYRTADYWKAAKFGKKGADTVLLALVVG